MSNEKMRTRKQIVAAADEEFMCPRNYMAITETDAALRELVAELADEIKECASMMVHPHEHQETKDLRASLLARAQLVRT